MRNIIKNIIIFLSIGTLILTIGCSVDNDENNKGRYVQEIINFLSSEINIEDMLILDNGDIMIVGYDKSLNNKLYISEDNGLTWNERQLEEPTVEGKDVLVNIRRILTNGDIFMVYSVSEDNESEDYSVEEMRYAIANNLGNIIEDSNNYNFSGIPSNNIRAKNGDMFYISDSGESVIQVNGENFEEVQRYKADDFVNEFAIVEEDLVIWEYDVIAKYNINTGEKEALEDLENKTIKSDSENNYKLINTYSENYLYYYDVSGLYRYNIKTQENNMIINGEISNFGDSSLSVLKLVEMDNEELLVLFDSWNNCELIKYSYNPDISSIPEETLKVYSLIENDQLRQAISLFVKSNSSIYVEYEVGITFEDGVTISDAIKKLNTEIAAGKGPDIILLDNLPVESYIDNGLLEDISDIILEYKNNDEIFNGMVEAYSIDDKIYEFPTAFNMPIIVGAKDVINKITDLNSLLDVVVNLAANGDRKILERANIPKIFIYSLYSVFENQWIYNNEINEENLKNFMDTAKKIYDINIEKYNIYSSRFLNYEEDEYIEVYEEDEKDELNNLSFRLSQPIFLEYNLQGEDVSQLFYGGMPLDAGFGSLVSILTAYNDINYKVLTNKDENIFIPINNIGVNSSSKQKENAKLFVKHMLSEKVQSNNIYSNGIAINKKSIINSLEFKEEDFYRMTFDEEKNRYIVASWENYTSDGKVIKVNNYWPNEEDIDRFISEMERLDVAVKVDTLLLMEVAEQFEKCITEEVTVNEAVDTIIDNLSLYLLE